MSNSKRDDALNYHSMGRPGKIEVVPTKPHSTQRDLSLAYSPGVAEPCLAIEKDPSLANLYTAKGNLVAVISNGTAVLGLGDIGALAGKPVMEGKGLLFKIFADIDVFDIEIETKDIEKFIETVKQISPTFGGINLEDISAPSCFEIEERLKNELDIPLMHDDQHGTAIISSAGLLNALEISGKKIGDIRMVVSGAGASAMACTKLVMSLGVKKENVVMVDSKGVITTRRKDLNKYKIDFAADVPYDTLEDAMKGADVFLGLSAKDLVTQDMVRSMAKNPIVFAMANPDPEITYDDATAARPDVIMATGRSDFPNQVNNVLGFPFIFRGALDVHATGINEAMKIAAVYALANLAKQPVPESVNRAYNKKNIVFGREYIIPKPLDPRLIYTIAPAVAKAAIASGIARSPITDWDAYEASLKARMGLNNELLRTITDKARSNPQRIVFADANKFNVIKAAQLLVQEGIAKPVLLGNIEAIMKIAADNQIDMAGIEIINQRDESESDRRNRYAEILFDKRKRKGLTHDEALERLYERNYFGCMMVETGDADAFIAGQSTKYAESIKPAIEVIGISEETGVIAGLYVMQTKRGNLFFADTTVNVDPSSKALADITVLTAETVHKFGIEPVIALVSFSNFGGTKFESPKKVADTVKYLHQHHKDLIVDGEFQANFALNKELRKEKFPFTKLGDRDVNTLVFPNLDSGNIAYKMMLEIGGAQAIGPILMGLRKPVHILQIESSVRDIVNMATFAAVDAIVGKEHA
ncbi:MAG TPA: NADP-dependent malic enzyme [Bacteroidales bacterium]|nr:NADP-dependent malic enzyme [Bacteroidales bacterium]